MPPPKRHRSSTHSIGSEINTINDELGKQILSASSSYSNPSNSNDTWASFIRNNRGPPNQSSGLSTLPHPARRLLKHLGDNGAPVVLTTEPWSLQRRDDAMARGSHASTKEHEVFLRVEMSDLVSKGFWIVLPYSQVRSLPGLRISPLGVVPQRDRRPRTIVDYTFSFVNADTASLAPRESMQFGHALHRMLRKIRFADPAHGPVYMLKVDIADGFYRVYVAPRDVPKLGVAFPHQAGEEPLVAFPLALPMGWTSSPPYFSAFTETIVDVANDRLAQHSDPLPHRLDTAASTRPPPLPTRRQVFFEGEHPVPRPRDRATTSLLRARSTAPSAVPPTRSRVPSVLRRARTPASSAVLPTPRNAPSVLLGARSTASSAVHLTPRSAPFVPLGARSTASSAVHLTPSRAPSILRRACTPASSAVLPTPRNTPSVLLGARSTASSAVHLTPRSPPFVPLGARSTASTAVHLTPSNRKAHRHHKAPLQYFDVFVDDALSSAQGSPARLRRIRRILLGALDDVFRPLDSTDPSTRQEPASVKKMLKGDACWATLKIVLGWLIDTVRGTIELPPHRLDRIKELFDLFRGRRRVASKQWYQLLGELRSMTLAIPGGTGMFSHLQEALRLKDKSRVKLNRAVHDQLADLEFLTQSLGDRPTRIAEIVPTEPTHVGACDAARPGMGGVWVPPPPSASSLPSETIPPMVWRESFPRNIQDSLVSFANPHGSITNSDLELAGVICHQDIVAAQTDCRELTLATLCDNTPAVAWIKKGSVSNNSSAAYLLRVFALHQRHHRYLTEVSHIPGVINTMADDASRLWHLSDSAFLSHFNTTYPQQQSWVLCPLRLNMSSAVISALQKKRPSPESFLAEMLPPARTDCQFLCLHPPGRLTLSRHEQNQCTPGLRSSRPNWNTCTKSRPQAGPISNSGGVPPLRRSGLHQRGGPGPTPPGRHPPP
jgi:hypothetical protein